MSEAFEARIAVNFACFQDRSKSEDVGQIEQNLSKVEFCPDCR
jgi:hypothetical protein